MWLWGGCVPCLRPSCGCGVDMCHGIAGMVHLWGGSVPCPRPSCIHGVDVCYGIGAHCACGVVVCCVRGPSVFMGWLRAVGWGHNALVGWLCAMSQFLLHPWGGCVPWDEDAQCLWGGFVPCPRSSCLHGVAACCVLGVWLCTTSLGTPMPPPGSIVPVPRGRRPAEVTAGLPWLRALLTRHRCNPVAFG